MSPINQTMRVLVTSTTDLAKEETFFVTVTPKTLKQAIVNIPSKTKNNNRPLSPNY